MSDRSEWLILEVERVLYVDRGRKVILCDRDIVGQDGGTIIIKLKRHSTAPSLLAELALLDAEQATAMVRYILDGLPAAGSLLPSQIAQRESAKKWRDNHPAPAEPTREALLDRVIRDSIEALERNSTSAPVVECLKAALAHSAPAAGTKSAPVVPASHNSGECDPSVMPDYAGADTAPTAHPAPAATRSMWQRPEYDPELSLLGAVSEMAASHSPAGSSPELEAILKDPAAVHLNMLRGGIAMPSLENIKHLYPEVRDAFAAVEEMRKHVDDGLEGEDADADA